jgi:hypothetical protein
MHDLAPDIFRQRLLIEGFYSGPMTVERVRGYLLGVAAHLALRTYADPIVFSPASEMGPVACDRDYLSRRISRATPSGGRHEEEEPTVHSRLFHEAQGGSSGRESGGEAGCPGARPDAPGEAASHLRQVGPTRPVTSPAVAILSA